MARQLDSRTYPSDSIRGLPTLNETLSSQYFSPEIFQFDMPQRNLQEEMQGMRDLAQNEIRMQRYKQPQLIKWEGQNALKRLQNEQMIAGEAAPLLEAERARNPMLAMAERGINASLSTLGPSRIETEMERQAYNDLLAGRDLSPQENRDAIQSARAAMSARGLATGNSGVMAEVLNRDTFARAREAQRRGFAAGVEGMRRSRAQGDMALAQSGYQFANQNFNPRGALFGTADMLTKNRTQPMTFTNQLSGYMADFGNANLQAATAYNAQQLGGSLELARMQHDIGMTLMNARFNNDIGAANAAAAAKAGQQAMTGQIAGAAIGAVGLVIF